MVSEHEHYCQDHDHRFRCVVDPCVLPVAWLCDTCRCGALLKPQASDPLAYACARDGDGAKHDRLVVQTSRRSA